MSIADLLKAWPQTTQVFFRHRMACVGCSMAAFDTIEDAQKNYCLDLNTFLDELDQARQGSKNY